MKNKSSEQVRIIRISPGIKANLYFAKERLWECERRLKYKLEQSEYLDIGDIKDLLGKVEMAKKSIERIT